MLYQSGGTPRYLKMELRRCVIYLWISLYSFTSANLAECGEFGCYKDPFEDDNFLNGLFDYIEDYKGNAVKLRESLTFSLYCSRNRPTFSQVAKIRSDKLYKSYFANRPTKLLIHGWKSDNMSRISQGIKDAYLDNYDVNVIIVDWSLYANKHYSGSLNITSNVAELVSEFIDRLINEHDVALKDIHIIGHSLGAHISNMATRIAKSGKVGRVTGLDPAAPLFDTIPTHEKFSPESADFVDVIHTCGKILGIRDRIGKVDFYPNGGDALQLGCEEDDIMGACSHARSYEYFIEALRNPKAFICTKCSDWMSFRTGKCEGNDKIVIGEHTDQDARGTFFLKTNNVPPYGMGDGGQTFTRDEILKDDSRLNSLSLENDWFL